MLQKGFRELAAGLIAADTVSDKGTVRAAELLQPLWEHAGLRVLRQVVEEISSSSSPDRAERRMVREACCWSRIWTRCRPGRDGRRIRGR